MTTLISARFAATRDTAANWTAANPTLALGEFGYETDTGRLKVGTGSTAWSSLPYFAAPGFVVTTAGSSYTDPATLGEKVVMVTGAAVTVTLPTAAGNKARLTYKLTVAGTMTLNAASGQTIDGDASAATTVRYTAITIVSDGSNWQII
jgi:hypothetical protein